MLQIKAPMWLDGDLHIGVADFRVGSDGNTQVELIYKLKDGTPRFPGYYEMPANKLKTYPTKEVKGGVRLYVSPLKDWDHKGI